LTFGKEFTEAVEMKQVGEYSNADYNRQKSNWTKLWVIVSCHEQNKESAVNQYCRVILSYHGIQDMLNTIKALLAKIML